MFIKQRLTKRPITQTISPQTYAKNNPIAKIKNGLLSVMVLLCNITISIYTNNSVNPPDMI